MAVLPAEIPTGLVTGQFYFVNEDNVDADTDPTLTVVSGRVTFTCEAETPLRMPTKDAVIIPLVFEAGFDSQGRLVPKGQTNIGIELPASDSPLFNPTGFTWRVDFDLVDATTGYTIRMDSFSIIVPEGVTSDMVDLMPVSTEPGTIMVQGPQGIQGIQGIQGPQGDGVPAGGTALQILRRNSAATGSEWVTPTKSIVGLGNVDNTSDVAKPVSTAQQTALDGKSNTGHVHDAAAINSGTLADARLPQRLGINPGSVSDWNTINQTGWWMGYDALNSPTPATWYMGMVEAHNNNWITQTVHNFTADGSDNTQTWRRSGNDPAGTLIWGAWYKLQLSQAEQDARYQALIAAGTTAQYWRGDKTWQALNKAAVGLSSVDNTSDANKPVSTAVQAELNKRAHEEVQMWAGWRKAVAEMATRTAKWLAIGDSITEGTGVTTHADTWLYRSALKIRDAYPAIAANTKDSRGWTPVAGNSSTLTAPWTIAANGGSFNSDSTFGFRWIKSTQITNGATITGTVVGTSIDVWWTQGSATGAFTVKVDSGAAVAYGGSSSPTKDGFVQRISLGASGSHTVVITAPASASAFISGVTVYDGNENAGIVTLNAGVHGVTSTTWNNAANSANWKQNITTLNPDLVTILLGANDYTTSAGRIVFSDNIKNIVKVIRDNTAGWPTIGLISCYKQNVSAVPAWEHYQYGLERAAAEIGCAYFDLRTKMPDVGSAQDTQGYYYDTVHPNVAGNEKMATEISAWLLSKAA